MDAMGLVSLAIAVPPKKPSDFLRISWQRPYFRDHVSQRPFFPLSRPLGDFWVRYYIRSIYGRGDTLKSQAMINLNL